MPRMGKGEKDREFIRTNLLTVSGKLNDPSAMRLENNTVWVKLVEVTKDYEAQNVSRRKTQAEKKVVRTGEAYRTKPAKIYRVMPAQEAEKDSFAAYICPYQENKTRYVMLENAADVMFTADLNGCTFGVGIPNTNGGLWVGHSNKSKHGKRNDADGTLDYSEQYKAQLDKLASRNTAALVVQPSSYRGDAFREDLRAVIIGLRVEKVWEFWYQHQNCFGVLREMLTTTKIQ